MGIFDFCLYPEGGVSCCSLECLIVNKGAIRKVGGNGVGFAYTIRLIAFLPSLEFLS